MLPFKLLATLMWLVFYVYWLLSALRSKKNVRSPRWGRTIISRLCLVAFCIGVAKLSHHITGYPLSGTRNVFVASLCIGVMVLGMGFAVWARVNIGRNWGAPMSLKKDPELVTSGPYALVRHPIYSGMLLALLASVPIIGEWLLLPTAAFAAYSLYSASVEEKNMSELFPVDYPQYMQRSKRLIPFIL